MAGKGLEIRKNWIRPTLFARALAAFIVVMAPIYILSALLNMWGYNNVRQEQMESYGMSIRLYLDGLEREFNTSLNRLVELVDDNDMKLLASESGRFDDVEYYKANIAVRKLLTDIRTSSPFITEAVAYIPAKHSMLSTSTGFMNIPPEYEALKESVRRGAYPFCDFGGGIVSAVTSDALLGDSDKGTFLLEVKFSREKILNSLAQYEDAGQGRRAALIAAGRGITAIAEENLRIAERLKAFALEQAAGSAESGTRTIEADGRNLIVSWAKSGKLQTVLLFYTPEESFAGMLVDYRYWLVAMSLLIIGGVFLYSVWIKRLIIAPLNKLMSAYRRLEKGDFNVELKYARHDEFGFIYERSNETFRRLGILIEQVYEQKIHAREAELKQLQYQINPHFLYNSIVIVGNLIRMTDYDVAAKLAHHLGNYYQYLTKAGDFVELEREAAHARNYIEIQKIRFADRFSYGFDEVPEGWRGFIVPRLILQPIIENAFKYGLGDTVSGGKLHVGIEADAAAVHLVVEDNGSIGDEKIAELERSTREGGLEGSTGLFNVHRRVQIRFGPESGLLFRRSALGGLAVEIRIARREEEGDAQFADR